MKKITKEDRKIFIQEKLRTNKVWAIRALLQIYNFQTEDEKRIEQTTHHNGVGFTGCDGEILSSFAKFYLHKNYLTSKQMIYVYKKVPKYWNQIINISDITKLDSLIVKS